MEYRKLQILEHPHMSNLNCVNDSVAAKHVSSGKLISQYTPVCHILPVGALLGFLLNRGLPLLAL
jgi:hypothetical protein